MIGTVHGATPNFSIDTLLGILDSAIRDAIGADRALVINSAASDTAIRQKQEYSYAGLRRIIELSPGLADFAEFQQWAAEFWTKRNETMDANIVRIAALFPGHRVAVICG